MRITDRGVAALKPKPSRYEAWEDGRTGLGVRVSPQGRKSWIYMYRYDGKARRMTLGAYPKMGVADAKLTHADARKKVDMGIDPGVELVGARKAERNAETVADLIAEYLVRHARPNKRSADADERLFNKDVLPGWGERKAKSITRRDVIALLDNIVDRGSPVMANRTLSALKKVWNFGLDRDILDATPFARIKPPTKEIPRDRILSPEEIRTMWRGLDGATMREGTRLAIKLILTTAQRRGEVALAEWTEFDLEENVWTVPAERSKNGIANRVPLSPLALKLLTQVRDLNPESSYLFPSPRGDKAVGPLSISHGFRKNLEVLGLEAVTPHDLRRTAVSLMTGIGISRLVTEKIINHKDSGVASIYDRHGYQDEKRHALDAWGARLQEIISGQKAASNVVGISGAVA